MHVNHNMYNYFTMSEEEKKEMDSFVVIAIYECIAKSMIERLLIFE